MAVKVKIAYSVVPHVFIPFLTLEKEVFVEKGRIRTLEGKTYEVKKLKGIERLGAYFLTVFLFLFFLVFLGTGKGLISFLSSFGILVFSFLFIKDLKVELIVLLSLVVSFFLLFGLEGALGTLAGAFTYFAFRTNYYLERRLYKTKSGVVFLILEGEKK